MHNKIDGKMSVFKKVFLVLVALDVIGSVLAGISLLPTFGKLAEYGKVMAGVIVVMVAAVAAIQLFEILAKVSLIKSASAAFSWTSGRKRCVSAARFLVLFNLAAIIVNMLSAGGEGATLMNQANLYLRILASAAEVIAALIYLRAVKKR